MENTNENKTEDIVSFTNLAEDFVSQSSVSETSRIIQEYAEAIIAGDIEDDEAWEIQLSGLSNDIAKGMNTLQPLKRTWFCIINEVPEKLVGALVDDLTSSSLNSAWLRILQVLYGDGTVTNQTMPGRNSLFDSPTGTLIQSERLSGMTSSRFSSERESQLLRPKIKLSTCPRDCPLDFFFWD